MIEEAIIVSLVIVSSNIMSLGGLALAIGVLVDAAIVMVENGYRHISERPQPIHCPSEELTQLMRN